VLASRSLQFAFFDQPGPAPGFSKISETEEAPRAVLS